MNSVTCVYSLGYMKTYWWVFSRRVNIDLRPGIEIQCAFLLRVMLLYGLQCQVSSTLYTLFTEALFISFKSLLQLLIKLMPTLYTHALHIKHSRSFEEKGSIAATSMSFNPLDSAPAYKILGIHTILHPLKSYPLDLMQLQ